MEFKTYDTCYLDFFQTSNWGDCRSQIWRKKITIIKLSFFKTTFSLWFFKCIFKPSLKHHLNFCQILNWGDCKLQFWSNHMNSVNLWFFKETFTLLSSKCISINIRKGLHDLEHMTHVACAFVKYQTRAITVLKWSRDFRKIINKVKSIFATIFQIYFQSFSEWFIGFKANDTSFLLFCQISNWSDYILHRLEAIT